MSTPFKVIVFGPEGKRAKLFKEPDTTAEVEKKLIESKRRLLSPVLNKLRPWLNVKA